MKRQTILTCTMLFLLLSLPNARGAMVQLSLEHLVQEADLIVLGTIEGVESEFITGKIFSFATVSASSTIKGELEQGQNEIDIRFAGGTVGDIAMKVENSPEYHKDEYIVVFLKIVPGQTHFKTVGSFQGKFLIRDNMVVRENLPLSQFLDRIQNILGSAP